jgi:hypothetical protein
MFAPPAAVTEVPEVAPVVTDPPAPPVLVVPATPAVPPLPAVGIVPPEVSLSFVGWTLLQAVNEAIVSPTAMSVRVRRMRFSRVRERGLRRRT